MAATSQEMGGKAGNYHKQHPMSSPAVFAARRFVRQWLCEWLYFFAEVKARAALVEMQE